MTNESSKLAESTTTSDDGIANNRGGNGNGSNNRALKKQEQFVNTQKWNDIISSFSTQMPLKKHWRNLRAYSNCFVGSDAIDWMLRYLKTSTHFKHLTLHRANAIAVLQIMYKDKLFEDVRASGGSTENFNPKPFADDDRLYRFSSTNPHIYDRYRLATSNSMASSSNSSISISTATNTRSLDLEENSSLLHHQHQLAYRGTTNNTTTTTTTSTTSASTNNGVTEMTTNELSRTSLLLTSTKNESMATTTMMNQTSEVHQTTSKKFFNLPVNKQTAAPPIEITKYRRISSPKKPSQTQTEPTSNESKSKSVVVANAILKPNEAEIWSRMLRKSLESTLRKAVFTLTSTANISNISMSSSITSMRGGASNRFRGEGSYSQGSFWSSNNHHRSDDHSSSAVAPSITLRRSYDIKISLSKLLDRRAYELLLKVSGAYICHNCNNVNKHGVVTCDKNDDLPDWVIKGMHELINWDSKNTEKGYAAFKDIYNEIVNYYRSLNEPLLTADLSYLFIHVFQMLLLLKPQPPAQPAPTSSTTTTTNQITGKFARQQSSSMATEKQPNQPKSNNNNNSPTIVLIEELIDNLKSQLNEQQQREKIYDESPEASACSAHRLLSLINSPNVATMIKPKNIINETFEAIENKLIEDARLPIWFLMDNLQQTTAACAADGGSQTDETFLSDLHYLLNSSGVQLTSEQKEMILHNLLVASMSHMEDSCPDCVNTYNELTGVLNARDSEFDEFLMQYAAAGRSTDDDLTTTSTTNMTTQNSSSTSSSMLASIYLPTTMNAHNLITTDMTNDYEEDDLIDIDDDFETFNDEYNHNTNEDLTSLSSAAALVLLPPPAPPRTTSIAASLLNSSSLKQPQNRLIQKSLSEKKLRRNNSFRAAIENLTNDEIPPAPGDLMSIARKQLTRSSTIYSSTTDAGNYSNSFENSSANANQVQSVDSHQFKVPYPVVDEISASSRRPKPFGSREHIANHDEEAFIDQELIDGRRKRKAASTDIDASTKPPACSVQKPSTSNAHLHKISSTSSFASLGSSQVGVEKKTLCGGVAPNSKPPACLSLNELTAAIRSSLDKTNMATSFVNNNTNNNNKISDSKEDNLLNLSATIDSDQFFYIISAFRLLTLILPSKNRRKLHFLLRFLYKLKNSPQSAASHLLPTNANQKTNPERNHRINGGDSKDQLEIFVLKSFLSSIIAIHDTDDKKHTNNPHHADDVDPSELKTKLGLKLAQIFVNNYSEIMAIPQDLMSSVRQRLSMVRETTEEKSSSSSLSSGGLSSSNYSTIEGLDNQKMARKALNILGLNDMQSQNYPPHGLLKSSSSSLSSTSSSSSQAAKQKNLLRGVGNGMMGIEGLNRTVVTSSSMSSSSTAANRTILGSSSMAFSKFFNKKKKENLI